MKHNAENAMHNTIVIILFTQNKLLYFLAIFSPLSILIIAHLDNIVNMFLSKNLAHFQILCLLNRRYNNTYRVAY